MQTIATIAAVVLIVAGAPSGRQNPVSSVHEAPPELTILKHVFGSARRFTTEAADSKPGGEPNPHVVSKILLSVSVKATSRASKPIVGVSWNFVFVNKNTGEELFNIPFITPIFLGPQQTKTFKGDFDKDELPHHPRTVSVDELGKSAAPPAAEERVVITCVMFADGTFSALNDEVRSDCSHLQSSPEIKKKLQKP